MIQSICSHPRQENHTRSDGLWICGYIPPFTDSIKPRKMPCKGTRISSPSQICNNSVCEVDWRRSESQRTSSLSECIYGAFRIWKYCLLHPFAVGKTPFICPNRSGEVECHDTEGGRWMIIHFSFTTQSEISFPYICRSSGEQAQIQ